MAADEPYRGFEQGPIRPPSERDSLLVRVTRNCPWNRCTFCGLYKGERFSRRPVTHVLQDIDAVRRAVDRLSGPSAAVASPMADEGDWLAEHAARTWLQAGCRSVFLQDSKQPDHPARRPGNHSPPPARLVSPGGAGHLLRPFADRGPHR